MERSLLDVDRVVVAILELRDASAPKPLGTGFFVGKEPVLVTCNHVIKDCQLPLLIAVGPDIPKSLHQAHVISTHPEVDLAILNVPTYMPPQVLPFSQDEAHHGNSSIVTQEHSLTKLIGNRTILSPSCRVGNITRSLKAFDLELFSGLSGSPPVTALELSFPALRGSSGAPVMKNDGTWELLGIVVGNVGHELAPTQIETVWDEGSGEKIEEIRYLLPQGIAVDVRHLIPLIENL